MKLKDDPISLFLVVACVVLLGLYLYEDSQLRQLDEAERRAQAIDLSALAGQSCESHAAGFQGRALTLKCEAGEADLIADAIAGAAQSAGFDEVWIYTPAQTKRCRVGSQPMDCEPT